jgi:glyoxylase-like metal-dependent hydrolase (beta-lactamase superfamily II)
MHIHPLIASTFRSDGGSMFGLVPKPIWSKRLPADERNRIAQNANCLLVQLSDGRRGLVDSGCGDPAHFSEKERSLHALSASWLLLEELRGLNCSPEQIDFVVLTHLHWDHAGGCGTWDDEETVRLTFPNAQHFVHLHEWNDATRQDPLLGKSYPASVIRPLMENQQDHLVLVTDRAPDILPGIRMARSGGHTRGHCVVVLRDEPLRFHHPEAGALGPFKNVIFAGDVCPTRHHLRRVFQTAYDTFPLQTREWKFENFPAIAADGDLLCFDHDPEVIGAILAPDPVEEFTAKKTLPCS